MRGGGGAGLEAFRTYRNCIRRFIEAARPIAGGNRITLEPRAASR